VKDLDPVLPEPKLKYTPAVCVFGRLRDVSELELEAVPVGLVAEHSAAPPDAWARRAEHIGLTPWTLEVCARPKSSRSRVNDRFPDGRRSLSDASAAAFDLL
jgi:hypothetical protein